MDSERFLGRRELSMRLNLKILPQQGEWIFLRWETLWIQRLLSFWASIHILFSRQVLPELSIKYLSSINILAKLKKDTAEFPSPPNPPFATRTAYPSSFRSETLTLYSSSYICNTLLRLTWTMRPLDLLLFLISNISVPRGTE